VTATIAPTINAMGPSGRRAPGAFAAFELAVIRCFIALPAGSALSKAAIARIAAGDHAIVRLRAAWLVDANQYNDERR
jgi:hypothetical protein